jgi:RimJ/RimL family protein N-acetyltransferase
VTSLALSSCTLRRFRAGDEESLARNGDDVRIWRNLRDRFPHPYTHADAERWVQLNMSNGADDNLAIEVAGEVVGSIGIVPQPDVFRRSAEIGYWLTPALWGRGITTEAVRAMSAHVFATRDICRLFAGVFEHNPASTRVLENAGFVMEGRLRSAVTKEGVTMDQLLYARIRP